MEFETKLKDKLQEKPESNDSIRFLSSFAQDAIIQINEHGLIVYWNKSAERVFGLSEADVLNKNFHLMFAPERYLETQKNAFVKFRISGEGAAINKTLELEGKRKNGEEFPLELSLSSFQVNGKWHAVGIIRDISKRKRIEQKLRDSEEELRNIFDNINDAIYIRDLHGNFIDVNATACKRLGYEKKEFLQMHIRDINTPENIAENPKLFDEKLLLVKDVVETIHVTKSGKRIPVEIHGKQSLYQNESVIIAVSRDITQRKKLELKLRNSKEELRVLFDNINDAIYVLDLNGNFVDVNATACKRLGYEKREFLQMHIRDINTPDNIAENPNLFDEKLQPGRNFVEMVHVTKSGKKISVEIYGKQSYYQNEPVIIAVSRDITQRKIAEKQLKESEKRFKTIFDNAIDGILIADKITKKFTSGNKIICQMLGYNIEELKNLDVMGIHPKEDLPYVIDQFEKQSKGEITLARNIPIKRKDGSIFYAEINSSLITLGEKSYLMGIFRDITKQKIAEEQLKESEEKYKSLSNELEIILDNIPALIFHKDTKNNFIRVNKYIADAYKMKKDDLIGKSLFELYPKEVAQAYLDDDLEVITSGKPKLNYEEPWETSDGMRWALTSKIPLIDENGEATGIIGTSIDITGRKNTEEKLRKSETKFRNMINNLDVAFYQVVLGGKLVNHNPAYNMILGHNKSDILKNTNVKDLWQNPKLREEYLQQLLRDDSVKNYICHAIKKDGSKIVLQLNSHLIRDKEGKPIRIDGTFIDVTEKFNLERNLKKTLETTRKVLETLPMGIILVGNDKKIQSVNKAALTLLGYNNEFEILGKNWYENTCSTEKNVCFIPDQSKERNQTEIYLKDKSGNEIPVLKTVLPIILDDKDYLMEAFVDITSLKEIQNQLKESQEKYLDLIETSTLGILEINLIENKIEYVNPAFLDIIECPLKEIKTEKLFYKIIHPEDVSHLMSSREKRDIEFRILLRDGTTKWVAATRLYTYGINQHPINLRLWVIDITERKKSERLKEKFTEQLEKEVEYRTNDLKKLLEKQRMYLDQIEKSSRFKTEFLATMSHELRTPLNAIIGFTDLLIEGVFGELNKEQTEYIKDIDDSSNHLLDMITSILDISKIESGQTTLKIEEIQLNNIIGQVISTLKPLHIEKDINWELAGLKKEQFIFADRIKFKQIIYNLFSNAIKFTKKGKIIFEFKENKQDWEFAVKDTGIGISEKDFEIIFKDFKRVKSEYVEATQGIGLGLALTKRLVNLQGGDISFVSRLEKGTTFTFNIPKTIKEKTTNVKKVESFLKKL